MNLIVELIDNTEIEFNSIPLLDKLGISDDMNLAQIRSVFSSIVDEKYIAIEEENHSIRIIPVSSILSFKITKNI